MTHGLFIGVFPDQPAAREVASRVSGLTARHGLKGRPLREDRFHVSLCGFGAWPEAPPPELVAEAMAVMAELDFPAFAVQFEAVMSFSDAAVRHPFVLVGGEGMIGLQIIREQLAEALARRGVKISPTFNPHLTLLYDARLIPEHPIAPIRWTVREIVLVESLRGQGRYIRRGVHTLR